ncbi:hypothetical protein TSAR_005331, partial [Trichomalopsis sarcophagae]
RLIKNLVKIRAQQSCKTLTCPLKHSAIASFGLNFVMGMKLLVKRLKTLLEYRVAAGIQSHIENLVEVMEVWNMFSEGMLIDNVVELEDRRKVLTISKEMGFLTRYESKIMEEEYFNFGGQDVTKRRLIKNWVKIRAQQSCKTLTWYMAGRETSDAVAIV